MAPASPFFLGGCGRSGTTLLRLMLDSHRRLYCGPESRVFAYQNLDLEHLSSVFDVPLEFVAQVASEARNRAEFAARFFGFCCQRAGKQRWGEKTPKNVVALDSIFAAFPQAQFVHVLRDPRDVVCSLRTHPRFDPVTGAPNRSMMLNPLDACIDRWISDVACGLKYRSDPRYTEVRYEDLVRQPRETLEQLLVFLAEEWDEAVLRHDKVQGPGRDPRSFPQNPEAVQPIYTTSVGRGRRDLTPVEEAHVLQRCHALLTRLGRY